MGNESSCTLRYAGKLLSGKALLETSELLFRGETRLKIPFHSIRKIHATGSELHGNLLDGLALQVVQHQGKAVFLRQPVQLLVEHPPQVVGAGPGRRLRSGKASQVRPFFGRKKYPRRIFGDFAVDDFRAAFFEIGAKFRGKLAVE